MITKKVSIQDVSNLKQNQQNNVAFTSIATNSKSDTVELSTKKKENKALKYVLIAIGAAVGIIAIAKHKDIAKIFKKTPEVKPDIKPAPKETPKPTGKTSFNSVSSSSSSYPEVPSKKAETIFVPSVPKNKTETSVPIAEVRNRVDIVQSAPSPLVILEDVLKAAGVENKFIAKSKDKGYQLWHFTSPAFFKKFIEMHKDLSEFCRVSKIYFYNVVEFQADVKNINNLNREKYLKLAGLVKEKAGVDLLGEFKHYRFISQRELDAIKTNTIIEDKSGKYVTLCPDYGLSCNNFDYRITFKNTERIKKADNSIHDEQYKTVIDNGYSPSDIERVEKLVNGKWQEVEFLPKNKVL